MIDRQQKVEKARELFFSGYNCAQAVAVAFAPEMGMTEQQLARLDAAYRVEATNMKEIVAEIVPTYCRAEKVPSTL